MNRCWIECSPDEATSKKLLKYSTVSRFRCVLIYIPLPPEEAVELFRSYNLASYTCSCKSVLNGIWRGDARPETAHLRLHCEEFAQLFCEFYKAFEAYGADMGVALSYGGEHGANPEITVTTTQEQTDAILAKGFDCLELEAELCPVVLGGFHLYYTGLDGNPVLFE
jgi:hypothetical protein